MNQQNPTSPETRNEIKTRGKDWFQHSEDFNENLNSAFTLWDAVRLRRVSRFIGSY